MMQCKDFADTEDCIVEQVSDYLVTEPYGGVEQDVFLNGALKLRTLLTPEELLDRLHELEQAAQRTDRTLGTAYAGS